MTLIYHVVICNELPKEKKSFECRCEALKFIKNVINKSGKSMKKEDILASIRMYRIDDEIMKNHGKLYLQSC